MHFTSIMKIAQTYLWTVLQSVLTREIEVVPCETYHFKLAIADALDGIYDSGVFVDFLECVNALGTTSRIYSRFMQWK